MRPEQVSREWLESWCRQDGDCLLWTGQCGKSGQPRYTFRDEDLDTTLHLRRVVWKAMGRRKLDDGEVLTMSCGHEKCLNEKHMKAITKAVHLKRNAQASEAIRKMKVTAHLRSTRAKLTMDMARYVRASDKTLIELAGELGVSFQRLSMVRRGEAWAESALGVGRV